MSRPVIVIGAGGHAAALVDALLAAGREVLGATDPSPARGRPHLGVRVLGDDSVLQSYRDADVELALGLVGPGGIDREGRRPALADELRAMGFALATVVHPAAVVSPRATLTPGAQVLAAAVIQPGAIVGEGAIVNTGAIVEHGSRVGPWCHVAPGAVIAADVDVEGGTHVGAGAVVRQGLRLAGGIVVGAGAVVVRDLVEPGVYVGVPCALRVQDRRDVPAERAASPREEER